MSQQDIATKLKIWLFPSLVTILGTLIWRDVSEMKSDIKELLAQSNIDKTRIDNLERMVYNNNKTTAMLLETSPLDKQPKENNSYYASKDLIINDSKKKKFTVYLKRVSS
jgi:hypothetical protein